MSNLEGWKQQVEIDLTTTTAANAVQAADADTTIVRDLYSPLSIARGLNTGMTTNWKFGSSSNIDAGVYRVVSSSDVYQTPQVGGQQRLSVFSSSPDDDNPGIGAQAVTIQGLDVNGNEIEETVATGGVGGGPFTTQFFFRVFNAFVASGTTYIDYSVNPPSAGHVGTLEIRDAGASIWAIIPSGLRARGQAEIAAFTVPNNKTAHITGIQLAVQRNQDVTFLFEVRDNIFAVAPPYSCNRVRMTFTRIAGNFSQNPEQVLLTVPGPADIVLLAEAQTNNNVQVDASFGYVLVDN